MTLDRLINQYMTSDSNNGLEAIEEYLDNMPRTEKSIHELLAAIDSYDTLDILYQTLFDDFFELLTDEESLKYFNKYLANFDSDTDLHKRIRESLGIEKQSRLIDEALPLPEEEASFTVVDENGNERECTTLFTFDHADNGNHYIVYTDYSRDENGVIMIFAAIKNENGRLDPIETDEEWELIEDTLNTMKKEIEEDS